MPYSGRLAGNIKVSAKSFENKNKPLDGFKQGEVDDY